MRAGGVKTMILQTIEPRLLMGLGLAASIIGHLALTLGLFFAEAHPFDQMPSQAIAVEIVAPEQAGPLPEPAEPPKPAEPKQPDPIDFSALTAPVVPTTSPERQTPRQKSQAAAAPAPAPPPTPPPASQQAAAKPQATEAPQPALAPQSSPPVPPAPPPDITVKYGVMLGLPSGQPYNGIEAPPAYDTAKISSDDIAAFRRHLKTCSSLPESVAPTDKVRIVLRVLLSRDGKIMAEPALLEASASAKGPLLMQKAMDALQACQPYTMLPADKYKEWKVLDLPFTPQDFVGG
jgi:outer membrane biosynthesis protein TonB